MLNISRSSFYYRSCSFKRQTEDALWLDRIDKVLCEFPAHGTRQVTEYLKKQGFKVNRKRIQRLMREHGLLQVVKRRWIKTTDSQHSWPRYPNLIRDLLIQSINQVWVSDITYIRILTRFVYLAVILDAFSRKVIGYALGTTLESNLAVVALRMALASRQPIAGCIHHSDQGVQYASEAYTGLLKEHNLQISMAAKGNPYENALAESFFKTLKREEVYLWDYRTLDDVKERIPFFIQQVYNRKRLHSALGYQSPDEFESVNLQNSTCLVVT